MGKERTLSLQDSIPPQALRSVEEWRWSFVLHLPSLVLFWVFLQSSLLPRLCHFSSRRQSQQATLQNLSIQAKVTSFKQQFTETDWLLESQGYLFTSQAVTQLIHITNAVR